MTITMGAQMASAEEEVALADGAVVSVGPPSLRAEVRVDATEWLALDVLSLTQSLLRTLDNQPSRPPGPLTVDIVFTDNAAVAGLNSAFRGKAAPTNVLAFPSGEGAEGGCRHLGGIALAYGVMNREATERGISLGDHTTHLTLHGLLHLFGFDHHSDGEREDMERVEIAILKGLGVPDPYQGS